MWLNKDKQLYNWINDSHFNSLWRRGCEKNTVASPNGNEYSKRFAEIEDSAAWSGHS